MTVVIFGVGALGCLFGALLANIRTRNELEICLFGHWPEQIGILQNNGLDFTGIHGNTSRVALLVSGSIKNVPPADICLILVKSFQTRTAAREAAKVLKPGGLCLTLQNGLGNTEILAEQLGARRVISGVTSQAAMLTAPGKVLHSGAGTTFLSASGKRKPHAEALHRLFNAAGIRTVLVENPQQMIWTKLAINAAINPLTALLEIPNGELRRRQALRKMMQSVVEETVRVARAQGILLSGKSVYAQTLQVCAATAQNISSMLQDIKGQRKTEIEAISGQIVQAGQQLGIPTPANRLLHTFVQKKQKGQGVMPEELEKHLKK
ncbi:MAG: ketopantoate reductase family protein [bacterium]